MLLRDQRENLEITFTEHSIVKYWSKDKWRLSYEVKSGHQDIDLNLDLNLGIEILGHAKTEYFVKEAVKPWLDIDLGH